MTAIHETAYPRLRSTLSDKELEEIYTPTPDDLAFLHRVTKPTVALFGGAVLLKTLQRLGYFPAFDRLPPGLIQHLATTLSVLTPHVLLQNMTSGGSTNGRCPRYGPIWGLRPSARVGDVSSALPKKRGRSTSPA